MSSEKYEERLGIANPLVLSCALYHRRCGLVGKSNHSNAIYLS